MACFPRMTNSAPSFSMIACNNFATASGWVSASVSINTARSAPMANAVRSMSWHCLPPTLTAMISSAWPASLMRVASSTAISQNGFMDIFTLAVSTPLPSCFTRMRTLKSTTRFIGATIFMLSLSTERSRGKAQGYTIIPVRGEFGRPLSHLRKWETTISAQGETAWGRVFHGAS